MGRLVKMEKEKMWSKDFTLVVIGQIISLFGNAIIRLALPLYLLDLTHSASLYGITLALSTLPMICLSPIGGVMADRINKRNIMVALDFSTAGMLILFSLGSMVFSQTLMIIAAMMILYGIQALYQPTVQSSMPLLVSSDNLLKGNSIINQVNAISSLLGPSLGGVLYGVYGIWPVIGVGVICFVASAIMECFIVMPHVKQESRGNVLVLVKDDFKEGMHFVIKRNPVILKVSLICAAFNLALTPMLIVGLPIIIKINLNLPNKFYGYTQAAVGAGSLLGGIVIGLVGKKIGMKDLYKLLALSSISILPIAGILVISQNVWIIYGVIMAGATLCITLTTMFSIIAITYAQSETPTQLIGKVMSCIFTICLCAQPIGQSIYGVVFEKLGTRPPYIILISAVIAVLLSFASKRIFEDIKEKTNSCAA